MLRRSLLVLAACAVRGAAADPPGAIAPPAGAVSIRVSTFNVEDVRTEDLTRADHPRLQHLAEIIQRIRPTIILLNEIAYDAPDAPGFVEKDGEGQNARRFADEYLSTPQAPGLAPLAMRAFMAPVNTGVPSGFDLDNDGEIVTKPGAPASPKPDGSPGEPTNEGRRYGNDCWGFGTFPGQYGMGLLVDARLEILKDKIRTFRRLPWDYVPGAFLPTKPDGTAWFTDEEKAVARLSSKSHWDVPVRLPNGSVLHVLCSHPTPPAFDGPEMRNKKRNHDEIRFWADYISGDPYIVDDNDTGGGLERGALFVIVGDQNADPKDGTSFKNPMQMLLGDRRVKTLAAPTSDVFLPGLDPDDTSSFKLRVDYVLPSANLDAGASGVWRQAPAGGGPFPSDHFPVWLDVTVPAPLGDVPATPVTTGTPVNPR